VHHIRFLAQVPDGTWETLSAGRELFLSADWLRFAGDDPRCAPSYLVATAGGSVAGMLPCYRPTGNPDSFYQPELHFPDLIPAVPAEAAQMGLLIGGRLGFRTVLALAGRPGERAGVLARLIGDALRRAAEDGMRHAFLLFATAQTGRLVQRTGLPMTTRLALVADANLPALGRGFEDYLTSLRSHRRIAVRAEMRAFDQAGLRVEVREGPGAVTGPTVGRLAGQVVQLRRKHGLAAADTAAEAELRQQDAHLGRRAVLFLCQAGGEQLGFAAGYAGDDGWLSVRSAGFDYPRLRGAYEYFNTAIYRPLRYCYERGYAGLRLGAGTHEAKAMRGAVISPLVHIGLAGTGRLPVPASAGQEAAAWWRQEAARRPYAFDGQWEPWIGR
jgi:hypothetical protein